MYRVQSQQVAQSISIKALRQFIKGNLLFADSDELFYSLEDSKFVYLFQFGIISFFNFSENEKQEVFKQVKPFSKGSVNEFLVEDISVAIQEKTLKVTFDEVIIPEIDEEMIRLIMLHTSQSIALDRYSEITEKLLEEASVHTKSLEKRGRLKISSIKLKRLIGKTLNIKNGIYENLYIFDSPEVTWEDEQLAKLDVDLKNTFDLKNRYRYIQDRITIVKENLELFKDIWDHKESSTLEWIIIILIFVEIIDLFVTKVF
ncbi:RMD1 family protein [Patiriisocius hiemis]|uniref:RMD1 family protein n=1 Tax=Patiriisocius hiemis TaxID=3075604 RepID=A0ABU2YDP2_9FLAO|nr:RMD1 family protein [Constantimarinum sp. W242]MDT0556306.1 RMD1 family protein [Constantimarinum sp. W242]